MEKVKMAFEFQRDAEGFTEILETCADGSSILWDVRFPTKAEAVAAIEAYKRRIKCRMGWGI